MKKSLVNKFTLKILSLAIAILIWLLVMNVQDPAVTETFNDIPITIINQSYLASNLEIPLLVEGKDTVNVRIRAKRSVIGDLKREDIIAEADVTQIISMDTNPRMVPVKVTCPGVEEDEITVSPGNIPLNIEEQISVDKVIAPNYGETTPDKNYEIGSIKAIPEKVTISGPASLINKIDRVVARIDVSDMSESAVLESELKIYDRNQEELSEKQMSYLDLKDISENKVNVQVDLWNVRQEVQISANYSGYPKYGYEVSSVTLVPDTVSIAGTEEALQILADQGNVLNIPALAIDVSGQSADFETTVDISELLPENTKLARDINSSVVATVKIMPYNSREYDVSAAAIKTENKPDNIDVVFDQEKVTVRVTGKSSDLDKLKQSDIQLKVDLKDSKAGEYEMPVTVSLPEGCTLVNDIKVKMKLVSAAETSQSAAGANVR